MSDKTKPLTCECKDGELIIRIGVITLRKAAESCPRLFGVNRDDPPFVYVIDSEQLAADVRRELMHEDEDGSTPLHRLLDQAIIDTYEDGSTAFAEENERE